MVSQKRMSAGTVKFKPRAMKNSAKVMRKTGKSFRTRLRQLKLMNCPAIATAAIIGTVPSPNKAMNAAPM